eukprot:TRINITY_DN2454_c0_g1_i6.p1 TRINITY_DN2454_c0_g1~~TRINITY_DN2454_c0_g1_i6.p1  ORF type:complete len:592 (-),score=198.09 TRINITY_DN2454_c0_g1_i6:78-1853(-)
MSNLMGKLADRASIMKSAFSEMELAVIKATKHNTKIPKEKHVRRLVVYTHDEPHKIPEMIAMLAKRLEFPDWLVVMKTLCVFHRLMRDGNLQVVNELRYKSNIFNLRRFADTTSPEAHHQSIFVRKYSQYIEEKVLVYKILSVEFEKDASVTKTYTTDEAFERIPRLQSQMNALLNCRASKDHLNNAIIVNSFGMLLKDSFKLYKALNDGIINLLEHYFSMPKEQAVKALEIYKLFAKETDGIIQFYDISRKISKTDLPELQHAPTTLVEALENYIKDLDEGKTPTGVSQQDKKSIEKFRRDKSHLDKFNFLEDDDKQEDDDSDSDGDSRGKYKATQARRQEQVNSPSQRAGSFSSNAPQEKPQEKPHAQPPPQTQPQPQAQLFDFFDTPEVSSPPQTKSQPFDPFGPANGDFFSSPPATSQAQPFDPFGPTPQVNNYDQKKQNVQVLLGSQPVAPANTSSTNFFDFPPATNNGSGFANQPANGGFGGSGPYNGSSGQYNGSSSQFDNTAFFGGAQTQNAQQQQPFGSPFGASNAGGFGQQQQQHEPFGGGQNQFNSSPFGSPQQTQQKPSFQPVSNTGSNNPFLNDNPFG